MFQIYNDTFVSKFPNGLQVILNLKKDISSKLNYIKVGNLIILDENDNVCTKDVLHTGKDVIEDVDIGQWYTILQCVANFGYCDRESSKETTKKNIYEENTNIVIPMLAKHFINMEREEQEVLLKNISKDIKKKLYEECIKILREAAKENIILKDHLRQDLELKKWIDVFLTICDSEERKNWELYLSLISKERCCQLPVTKVVGL